MSEKRLTNHADFPRLMKPQWREFRSAVERHQISALYHCTPGANLETIFRVGGLLSRSEQLRLGVRPAKYHGWGKKWTSLADYVCLGFVPPRHIRGESDSNVVLRISPEIIWLDGVVFCPCNSAKEWYSPEEIGARDDLDAFEYLFRNEHSMRLKRQDAEILVPKAVALDWVNAILFLDDKLLRAVRWRCLRSAPRRFFTRPSLWRRFMVGAH